LLGAAALIVTPKARQLPQTPEQLLEELFAIFPEYRAHYTGSIHDDAPSFHSVLIGFSGEAALTAASEDQLHAFGELVNTAVESGGLLENAFGTCLLEHLGKLRARRKLWPHLCKAAREKTKP
jgi:hypothetical protein